MSIKIKEIALNNVGPNPNYNLRYQNTEFFKITHWSIYFS